MTDQERAQVDELLDDLIRLRAYIRARWNEERAKTGRGPLQFEAYRRALRAITEDQKVLPRKDGTFGPGEAHRRRREGS